MIAVREEAGRLFAERDGAVVGSAEVRPRIHVPNGPGAYFKVEVVQEWRRRGIGTALEERAAARARSLGKVRLEATVRDDDAESLAFFARRGYTEVGRMCEVALDLDGVAPEPVEAPAGYALVPLAPEHDRGIWEVGRETDADIPSLEPFEEMPFEEWCAANLRPALRRDLSVVALRHGRVAGFALLESDGYHAMTGVARASRGVGLATALKRAQIQAAKRAGLRRLHGSNDFPNAAMRRVNEKLGYIRLHDWVDLFGPPIV